MQLSKVNGKSLSASVIIPVYKNSEYLRKNLPKIIEASKNKKNKIKEIIVVDDGTPANANDFIRKEFEAVKLIKHSRVRGYSAAVNTGARSAKGKLLVLLSADAVPAENFLEAVTGDFEDPRVFAVSFREKGYGSYAGFFKNGFVGYKELKKENRLTDTFFVSTACGVYRRDYWMKVGGLDEKVLSPSYWEDIDLSYRAAKRGLVNLWNPKAVVSFEFVLEKTEFPKEQLKVKERNKLLFHWKNITSRNLFRKHLVGILRRLTHDPLYLFIILSALKRLKIAYKGRKKEVRESKISDEAILAKYNT